MKYIQTIVSDVLQGAPISNAESGALDCHWRWCWHERVSRQGGSGIPRYLTVRTLSDVPETQLECPLPIRFAPPRDQR